MATNKQKKRARVRQKMANREPNKLKQISTLLDQLEQLEAEAIASGQKR